MSPIMSLKEGFAPWKSFQVTKIAESISLSGICRHAKDFPWSSARFHLGMIDRDPLVQQSQWFGSPEDWKEYLREESHDLEKFREHFRTGRP